jgi:hypothetical protein
MGMKEGCKMNTAVDKSKIGNDYGFAALSPGEIQDIKAAEEKINREKSQPVVLLAYEKK